MLRYKTDRIWLV